MSVSTSQRTLFLGSFVHCKSLGELEFLHDSAVCVDEKGVIVALEKECDQKKVEEAIFPKLGWAVGEVSVRTAQPGQFFFPGFIGLFSLLLHENRTDYPQTPISMLPNTPTLGSLARAHYSTGSTPTLSLWKAACP